MMSCPACSREVPETSRFCSACGASVTDPSLTPTRVVPDARLRGASPPVDSPAGRGSPSSVSSPSSADSLDEGRFIPGTLLAGRYRIVGIVGRGGMGEVYRANDLKLGQPVALKFLPAALERDGALLARFHGEVRIARQVSHPNVCRVYDIAEVDGQHFLSMEYLDGESLAVLLRRIGRLPKDKAIEIARQLCAGLAAAHDKGVLHRDLKPANVIIDGRGKVFITDFGLAGLADQLRGDEVRAGTPAYMAPEQLAGKEVSVKSDLYSLGLVLYELFVGKAAFKADSLANLVRMRSEGEAVPTNPSNIVEGFDPAVERVILRCLESDPRHRPASALAVAAALPGGDPLAAALAAGETPSPDMVAAAGDVGGLRPAVAWACLASFVAGIVLFALLRAGSSWQRLLSPENPPEVLAGRAREMVKRLGYGEPPADTAYGLSQDYEYLRYIQKNDKSPSRWDKLAAGRPASIVFWYRQSPRYLEPVFSQGQGNVLSVSSGDPPHDVSGMASLTLDQQGRLLSFQLVPPQVEESPGQANAPDWTPLFTEAGLELSRFTPVDPKWAPLLWGDARAAWQGSYPEQPGIPVRIEAAAYRGKPVWFTIIHPWTRPGRMQPFQFSTGERASQITLMVLFIGVLVGSVLIARRNLRLGRGDRKGAFKIAAFVFTLSLLAWVLGGSHVPTFWELWLFITTASLALFVAGLVWVLYIALEPYVRRRWPDTIISWSRVVAGRFRDPLVGRDVLVGSLFGVGLLILIAFADKVHAVLGLAPSIPVAEDLTSALGLRYLASGILSNLTGASFFALALLFVLFVLRALLRREWLAALAFIVVFSLIDVFQSEYPLVDTLFTGLVWAGVAIVLLRFGLVAMVGCWFSVNLIQAIPVTLDISAWYSGRLLPFPIIAIAIAVYGFHTALAGQPLFKDKLFQE